MTPNQRIQNNLARPTYNVFVCGPQHVNNLSKIVPAARNARIIEGSGNGTKMVGPDLLPLALLLTDHKSSHVHIFHILGSVIKASVYCLSVTIDGVVNSDF